MVLVLAALVLLSLANALIAFGVAFYWHAKVILTLSDVSNRDGANVPRKALGDPNSPPSSLSRFIVGELYPELLRKWLKAIGYCVVSFLTAFLVVGFFQVVILE